MATWTIYKKLNVSPNSYPLVIPIKQYSSDFALKFKLYSTEGDLDIVAGATTKIRGTKRDGNGFELTGTRIGHTCTFSGTKAQMQQMTAAHGRCVFEVVVEQGGRELITANFYLEVQRAAMDAGTVTSESIIEEFADFQSKITAAQAAATAAQEQADRAEAAAESIDFGIDSTLSQSGQAADALETGFGINTIREPTRNLNNQIMGRWRARASGVIQESNVNYFGMRDMVPCEPDTAYTVSFGDVEYTGTMHIYTTWYDNSKTIISQSDNTQGSSLSATNTSPSNAAYIYANINIGTGITYTEDSWIQIEKGTTKTEHVPPYAPRGVTGNTENIADILNVLQYKTVMARDNIPANANIDDYKQPGVYSVTTDENAQALTNWPDTRRGELIVFNSRGSDSNYSYGKLQLVFTQAAYTYIRRFVSAGSQWSSWFKLANDNDLQSAIHEVKTRPFVFSLPSNPYKAVATKVDSATGKKTWSDKIKDIKSTCHLHVSLAVHFKKAVDKGYEHLAISNYHASVPTVPIKDILPTLSGYDQSVHVVPDYWVESPNAEHVYFTGEINQLHMNAIGSYLSSGADNTAKGSGGFDGTTDEFFELAMDHLKYANGGGVSINHPKWSGLTATKIIKLYDKGCVFGLEIYNADCEYHQQNGYALDLWDAVLSTGRQIYGLAVPDHSAESSSNPDWATWPWGYNHMLCRTSDEAEILTAYRNGRFYTTIDNDTLALNYFGVDSGVATIITSEPGTITFTTKTRSVVTENATEASLTLTSEDGYVRASCVTATNKLFTNAIML